MDHFKRFAVDAGSYPLPCSQASIKLLQDAMKPAEEIMAAQSEGVAKLESDVSRLRASVCGRECKALSVCSCTQSIT